MQAVVFALLLGAVLSRAEGQTSPPLQNGRTTYLLKVFTNEETFAGTESTIFVRLAGKTGTSDVTQYDIDVRRGSESSYNLNTSKPLGTVGLIQLEMEPVSVLPSKNLSWSVDKIEVTDSEGQLHLFPIGHRLHADHVYYFREGKDVIQECYYSASREKELKYRMDEYRWDLYEEGMPYCIQTNSLQDLPPEIQFSYATKINFRKRAREAFCTKNVPALKELNLWSVAYTPQIIGLFNDKSYWKSFDDFDKKAYALAKTNLSDYVKQHWRNDSFFGYQFLNGLNPVMIRRCDSLPSNFSVTDDMVSLEGGASLTQEMQNGNIFLVDYKILDGIQTRQINDKQQYLTAPLVLLHKTPTDEMKPIAIQLKQTQTAEDNPIFLPSDSEYDWLLAKTFVRSADAMEHQLITHLLRTHFLAEVYSVALLRNVARSHFLFKLLKPHTRYTLNVNILARKSLGEHGFLTENVAANREGLVTILERATSTLTYCSLCLPEDIRDRGVESVPNYYYRDDGLKIWNIINRFVSGILTHYYKNDQKVQEDAELQNYIKDIFELGFLNNTDTGIPQNFQTLDEVVKFVTMVIFTSSAQHAAINYGQLDFDVWMPNAPFTLQRPPPLTKGTATEETLLKTLPDINTSVNFLATLYLTRKQPKDTVTLGQYPYERFTEDAPNAFIDDFQRELEELQRDVIDPRNENMEFPYVYMRPENIENSITF